MSQWLQTSSNLLLAALVSAIVSGVVSYLFKRREIRFNLAAQYEYDQRKKLRELIGSYHGRVLLAADRLNQRFFIIYKYVSRGWFAAAGGYSDCNYHLCTTAHRLLHLSALAWKVQSEAVYIDARIAEESDFAFLNYLSAFMWCVTTVSLYNGLPYEVETPTDHIFADDLRARCDSCWSNNEFVTLDEFLKRLKDDRSLDVILAFLDGIRPDEVRLRWDKMVALHLLLMAFVNRFGYESQFSTDQKFLEVARQAQRPAVLENLVGAFAKLGLAKDPEIDRIVRAVTTITSERRPNQLTPVRA